MKMPDLTTVAEAGVRDWSGTSDVVKDAATAAKLAYYSVDLHGIASKADLLHALARGLRLPAHFGNNWDALADSLEDDDWFGTHGVAIVMRHAGPYRKAHPADWETVTDILGEAAEYWQERHKPFWVFVG
jgi:RNAse (barnase) inhibitor barstar